MLPSITNVINLADSHDRAAFAMATHVKQELRERENSETKEEVGHLLEECLILQSVDGLEDLSVESGCVTINLQLPKGSTLLISCKAPF